MILLPLLAGIALGVCLYAIALTLGVDAAHAIAQWRRDRLRQSSPEQGVRELLKRDRLVR